MLSSTQCLGLWNASLFSMDSLPNVWNQNKSNSSDSLDALTYQGCNAEQVVTPEADFFLPRSMYDLFFVYFSMKRMTNKELCYPIIGRRTYLGADSYAQGTIVDTGKKMYENLLQSSQEMLAQDLLIYFMEKKIEPASCTWKEAASIIEEIWEEIGKIPFEGGQDINFGYYKLGLNFLKYIYLPDQIRAKELLLNAISKEWSLPEGTVLIYRCGKLKEDHVKNIDGDLHSLSFGSSLLSGIVYEGTPTGTCPLSYEQNSIRDFYGLHLSAKKVQRYFFYPKFVKEMGLFSLAAAGEFSHPRLKVFLSSSDEHIGGVQGKVAIAKQVAVLQAGELSKIKDFDDYLKKITKIYDKNLIIFSDRHLALQ